jgi:two-component system NtrC family sensor kinase
MNNKPPGSEETVKEFDGQRTSRYKSTELDEHIVYGSPGYGEDAVACMQAGEALIRFQELSNILLQNMLSQVIVIDPDTSVQYVSPSFERLTGYSSDEIIGTQAPYPWWPEESAEYFEFILARNSKAGIDVAEKRLKRKNGEPIWVELSTKSVEKDGLTNYLLVNCIDITERRQMQEKLVMQDRLASVGHLSSGLAHEINNPLTSVITFSSLLLQRELPDDVREDIKMINDEAQRAARLVTNLLAFVRKQPQEKQPVNINEGIRKALELRAYEQKANNIGVDIQLAPGLPRILGSSSRLQQVFINIIINAEYFMHEAHGKGTLIIKTEKEGNYVRASFADDGPGIPEDNIERLFTPFFTTKESGKGTGLGLSICHGIVNEHNGRIWAENKPGKGAVFKVEFPLDITDSKEYGTIFEETPLLPQI